jgi:hypothetical protein
VISFLSFLFTHKPEGFIFVESNAYGDFKLRPKQLVLERFVMLAKQKMALAALVTVR